MKSKKTLLGALALSAALVVGAAVPALAAEGSDTALTAETADGSKTGTTVKIATMGDSDQVSVTVPLSMTVVAKTAGGDLITPDGYKIVNGSSSAVKVTPSYTLSTAGFNMKITDSAANTGSEAEAPFGFDGYLLMTLTPAEGVGTAWTLGATAPEWTIAANETAPLTVAGSTSKLGKQQNDAANAAGVVTLKYTVEKSTASLPPNGEGGE